MATAEQLAQAESYRHAAKERLVDAYLLYRERRYVLCLYSSGLAVECMFRAHWLRIDATFDSRHDLMELYRLSHLKQKLSIGEAAEVGFALSQVARVWRNDQRFESAAGLLRFVKRGRHDRGIRGDVLKETARRAYNASETIFRIGMAHWTS